MASNKSTSSTLRAKAVRVYGTKSDSAPSSNTSIHADPGFTVKFTDTQLSDLRIEGDRVRERVIGTLSRR